MTMEKAPLVSVVVCAFNEEKLIHSCLAGLAKQTYPFKKYEVLIIDDESTDNTFDIVSDFIKGLEDGSPHVRLVRIQHGGLSVARNAGIQLSNGEIIAFIDGDAVASSTWLEELVKPFGEGADYVGGRINLLNTDSWIARFIQRTRNRQFFGPSVFNDCFVGCNMAFRKEVFNEVGGFHENFVARGDESTLLEQIINRFIYMPAPNAVVLHERSETVMGIIRVEWKSATLASLVAKASGAKIHLKTIARDLEQFLIVSFPIFLCLVVFVPGLFGLPLTFASLAIIRRFYFRPVSRAIAKSLMRDYGFLRGTIGHILFCFIHNVIVFFGRIVSTWYYHNVKIIPPMTTPLIELNAVESKSVSKF